MADQGNEAVKVDKHSSEAEPDLGRTDGYGWVVGIGASAGGLEALTMFVTHLPETFAGVVIIAQHLAPHSKSMLVELLGRHAHLPVVSAVDQQALAPGTIYIVPPNHDIDLTNRELRLTVAGEETRPKPSVDTFFTSLARAYGRRSVGIVLSGTGSDGSDGIRAIRAAGGITLAQDTRSAKYDGMPQSAVDTGSVDTILPPDAIADTLVQILVEHEAHLQNQTVDEVAMRELFDLIRDTTGSDFRRYKPSTIQRRTAKRMAEVGVKSLSDYVQLIRRKKSETHELTKDLLISVTSFFRDPEVFDVVTEKLTEIVRSKTPGQEVRVWIAGCATGEEAFTVAMILLDIQDRLRHPVTVKVFGTDLDHEAILEARSGIYSDKEIEALPPYFRSQFLERRDNARWEISKRIRDAVVFAKQDLIQNPPFVKLDMVSCRNVLIYFETDLQAKILETFHYALLPSGFLLLGKSESASPVTGLFETLDRKNKLFLKLNVASRMSGTHGRVSGGMARSTGLDLLRNRAELSPRLSEVAYGRLVSAYQLGGVVVDEDTAVLQIVGDVTPYLGFHTAQADLRLQSLLPKGVGIEIPILIRKAKGDGQVHRSRLYRAGKSGRGVSFVILVRPLQEQGELHSFNRTLFLINFEPKKVKVPTGTSALPASDVDMHTRQTELEHELFVTREHLQTVIEVLGVSNEELQSLNEELSSTNEELQASNEELETTNEELQSTNEELTTLNEELNVKSGELRLANTSLENVQNSIGTPLIVLDQNMRVLRHNNEAVKIFPMIALEVGQDLTRMSSPFEIPEFAHSVASAVREGKFSETICENGNLIFQVRVQPSFDEKKRVVGAIVLFIDNSDLLRLKERLERNEQRVRAIIDGSPGMISVKDALGRYLMVNAAFRQFFGKDDDEIIGCTDRELFAEQLATQWRDADLETFLKRQAVRREEWVTFADQDRVFLTNRFPLLEEDAGAPYAIGTMAFDVTPQVKIKDELQASEARYRAIAEDQAVFVCRHDPELRITYINHVFATYFGVGLEASPGQAFDVAIGAARPVAGVSGIRQRIGALTPLQNVVQYELPAMRGDSERWVRWIHRGIFNSAGQVTEYQAVGFDVTEYRQSTDHLRRKEAIFTGIFDNTTDFITVFKVVAGNELVLESMNRSAELALGFAYTQLIGRRLQDFLNPHRAEEVVARYRDVISKMQAEILEEELVLPGGIKNFLTTIVPIPGSDGRAERVAALSRDVSSYKDIERDLRSAKENAEVANRAKSDFLASMSHELRTPLNVVLGLSQLLEGTPLDSEQDGYVKSIHRSGRVLLALIEDVLDISKIEAGKVRLENIAFDLRDMILEVTDLFATQANEKNIELRPLLHPDAERTVVGDPGRLRQVLVNFVSNALKFTDRGSITLEVVSKPVESGPPIFRFEVRDTGIGIRDSDHEKIFKKFSQVQSGNSRRYGGSGLGLVISKHLMELMGGEIGFASEHGQGSSFWFEVPLPVVQRAERLRRLPAASARELTQLSPMDSRRKTMSSSLIPVTTKPLRVLAVDDNRESQAVIALLLRRIGHITDVASDGFEAIEKLKSQIFDVVLMDIQMPGMDGYETTGKIRLMSESIAQIPIIALTANALIGDAEKCLQSGMDAYLTKPVRIEALREALQKWADGESVDKLPDKSLDKMAPESVTETQGD